MNQVSDKEQSAAANTISDKVRHQWCEFMGLPPDRVHAVVVYAWQSDEVHEKMRDNDNAGEVTFLVSSTAHRALASQLLRGAVEISGIDREGESANH